MFNVIILCLSVVIIFYIHCIYLNDSKLNREFIETYNKKKIEYEEKDKEIKNFYNENTELMIFNKFSEDEYLKLLFEDYLYFSINDMILFNDLDCDERANIYERIIKIKEKYFKDIKEKDDYLFEIFDFIYKYPNIKEIKQLMGKGKQICDDNVIKFKNDYDFFRKRMIVKYHIREKNELSKLKRKNKIFERKQLYKELKKEENNINKVKIKKINYILPLIILLLNIIISIMFIVIQSQ